MNSAVRYYNFLGKTILVPFGSREWANDQLRFAIGVLKGQRVGSRWPGRVQIALLVRDRLLEYGWTWQAERVENWIHRCLQPCRADPRERQGGIP